jgi:hypothetical protein
MSPGIDPSSFSGRTKKGIDLDISSAFKETDPARWAVYDTTTKHIMRRQINNMIILTDENVLKHMRSNPDLQNSPEMQEQRQQHLRTKEKG